MRTLVVVTTSILLLSLSGCQHMQLMQQNPDPRAESAGNAQDTSNPSTLRKFWARQLLSQTSIQDYPAACLAESKMNQPMVVGQVIDTPRYAMITLAKQQQPVQAMGGELCIINKISQHVEITAVDDLRFMTPVSSLPVAP